MKLKLNSCLAKKKGTFLLLFLSIVSVFLLSSYVKWQRRRALKIRAGQKMEAYGLGSVPAADLAKIKNNLAVNLVVVAFNLYDTEASWRQVLEEAKTVDLKVIVKATPSPWHWTGQPKDPSSGDWDFERGEKFLNFLTQYLEEGEEIFALYALQDPFWQGDYSLGYSSAVQKKLYQAIKSRLPTVKLLSDVGSLTFWENYSPQTRIENEMFDYAGIWLYPFNDFNRPEEAIARIEEDARLIEEKGLSIGLVFKIQTFSISAMDPYLPPYQPGNNFYLPGALSLREFGCQVVGSNKIDVVLYYPWKDDAYVDYLANHSKLWREVNWVLANCQP